MTTSNKFRPLVILALVSMFGSVTPAQQFWFLKIRPLEMHRDDLQKLTVVRGRETRDDEFLYKLKEGNLLVGVSLGRCKRTSWGTWDVDEGTILSVIFYPAKERKPSYFGLSTEGMEKGNDHGHSTFTSDDKGLYFSVESGYLRGVYLYPPPKKYTNLRCSPDIEDQSTEVGVFAETMSEKGSK